MSIYAAFWLGVFIAAFLGSLIGGALGAYLMLSERAAKGRRKA